MASMSIRNLAELLRVRARTLPERVAYTFLADGEVAGERLTYAQLDRRARALAAVIRACTRPGDAVILAYPAGLEFIAAFFGCLYAETMAVPVGPVHARRGNERLCAIIADCEARLVATTAAGARALASAATAHADLALAEVLTTDDVLADDDHAPLPYRTHDASIAFLQYTSGSTQSPRGVCVSHASVLENLRAIEAAEGSSQASRGLSWLPAYHDMGLIEGILQPLYAGYPTWLMPHAAFVQRPARWLRAISRYGVTVSGAPNFAYDLCVQRIADADLEGVDLGTWDVAYCGAEPVKAATMREFAQRFGAYGFKRSALRPVYGLAEATLLVAAPAQSSAQVNVLHARRAALDEGRFEPAAGIAPDSVALVACGRPVAGTAVAIVDPELGSPVAPGTIGEIWVSGPGVARGYRRQAVESPFLTCAIDGAARHWLRTGDLGFMADGELIVSGRMKDLIIVRGRKIHPHDLERTVERCDPRIMPNTAAAFASQAEASEHVVLCIEIARATARLGAQLLATLADTIRDQIYRHHAVAIATVAFVGIGVLPRTSSGKLMRFRLRRDFCAGAMEMVQRFDNYLPHAQLRSG
jgi:acyl-CoA synthetase (AMP-forming)/AMP-acid ligase II